MSLEDSVSPCCALQNSGFASRRPLSLQTERACRHPLRETQHFSAHRGKRRVVGKLLLVKYLLLRNGGALALTFTLPRWSNAVQS